MRRRWLDRPLPPLGRRYRERREQIADGALLDPLDALGLGDNLMVGLAIVAAVVLLIFVVLPLLGVALELVFLFAVFCFGLLGRVALRRPWTVEAVDLDRGERSVRFAVIGLGGSGRAVDELATAIAVSGPPEQIAGSSPASSTVG